eukprot:s206_g28.t1
MHSATYQKNVADLLARFCANHWHQALHVLNTAVRVLGTDSRALYNGVLKACATSEQWELVIELMATSTREPRISLDMLSYGIAASALAKGKHWQHLLALFEGLSFQEERPARLNPLLLKALQFACEGHTHPISGNNGCVSSSDLRRSLSVLPVPSTARDVLYAVSQQSNDAARKLLTADVLPAVELREGLRALSLASVSARSIAGGKQKVTKCTNRASST